MTNVEPVSGALEQIPDGEAARIENIVRLTIERLKERYVDKRVRRGVHPKDHGCVTATFTVLDSHSLPEDLRVGVFSKPGQRFDAFIRFSNADVDPEKPDSAGEADEIIHGSRGMAVKLLGVTGSPLRATNLMTTHGPFNQDFLMINQPVFAFANVVDYEALSEVLLWDKDVAERFFKVRTGSPDLKVKGRAARSFGIVKNITSNSPPPPFQAPPVSPLDNQYFSAAAFLFGEGRAMKFSAKPVSPVGDRVSDVTDKIYLRTAMKKRLAATGGKDIEFDFLVQVRNAESLAGKLETEVEDVCSLWAEEDFPFVPVAKICIPPQGQDIDSTERMAQCEDLFFSPWNGLAEHRPLGGINRLRLAVYEASARTRRGPTACPWNGG